MDWTTAWMVGLINDFCVEISLVAWVSEIPLIVLLDTLGSLFGLLPSTTNFLESIIASTCSAEPFLNQFLESTCSSESIFVSNRSSDWIVHPLNYLTISSRTPAVSHLYNDQFASIFCTYIVMEDWNEVSHVILLMLRSIYSSSCSMTQRTAYLSFLLDNHCLWLYLYLFRRSRMLVKYSLPSVAMYDLSYDTSGLFILHSNTL